ncbi:MAG: alanine--tRNA ligase, partial [Cetobacterium sp.]
TTDDEAEKIWIEKCNFPKERIVRMGESENWWAAGLTGSCGPCSEIHVDLGVAYGGDENSKLGDEGTDNRFIEIWNLVFTEWNRMEDGSLQPLPKKNIDTGAGLERVAAMVQGKSNNFETDLILPIVEEAGRLTNTKYGTDSKIDFSLKVITDHSRAVTFLINDGVIPSNEGRGYVLRRILRRAVRHGRMLGRKELFMYQMVDKVVELMGEAYPELRKNIEHIKKVVKIEEEKFSNTLDQGIQLVTNEIKAVKLKGESKLSGDITFKMYDTYGFPYELTEEICEENDIKISNEEFLEKMQEQREKARSARTVIMEKGQDSFIEEFYDKYGKTEFTGYTDLMTSANLLSVRELEENRYALIFDKTPFYAESGGQESDNGIVEGEKLVAKVVGIQKQKEIYTHIVEVETGVEELTEGALLSLTVDPVRREEIAKNHTATHLLHQALKDVLGSHVQQAGSSCGADRLRFDFNHYEGLTAEELEKVEKAVNERIFMSTAVNADVMSMDEAKAKGATALFGDKYGN